MTMKMQIVVAGAAALALAGCASVPARTGTSYECSGGTRLTVNYLGNGALVRINGGRTLSLYSTPANNGQVYENKKGVRLHRQGNQVTWNTALRSAPETCNVVMRPL